MGLTESAIDYVLWGDTGHGPGEKVSRETAEVVLGYWPKMADFPDNARIDPTGTRRRIDALEVLGFGRLFVADRIGMPKASFSRALRSDRITAQVARAVMGVYEEMWNQRPEDHGVLGWVADRTRRSAQARGLFDPWAWDDDTIDDPSAVPQIDPPAPSYTEGDDVAARFLMGESVVLDRDSRREVLAHYMEWTSKTPEEIGALLDMSAEGVSRAWERVKAKARKEGTRVPWRRVYVPMRDMGITQNDLRSAA
ncbi:hypothetical protein [[Kitasatospora] papulosa]|uniref:hypothetical protein n=1 Tax=[Kitasatospora] papulosa TaxID=1464011 RepID=UPI0038574F01